MSQNYEFPENATNSLRPVPGLLILPFLIPLVVIKLFAIFAAAPTPDEAYYWLWGQHLAWSYYDHPPLLAWLQRLSYEAFGWNVFALRVMVIASNAGCLWIQWYWVKRFSSSKNLCKTLALSVTIWLSIPILMRYQSVAHQDHLLIFFGMLTAHFFALFALALRATKKIRWELYFSGCVALGLAVLSKYNGVLIGIGIALWIISTPKMRPLLRYWQLWMGGLLSVLIQAPVLVWNGLHGWTSFEYNLYDRIGQYNTGGPVPRIAIFLVASIFFFSPYILMRISQSTTTRNEYIGIFSKPGLYIAIVTIFAALIFSIFDFVLPHWVDVIVIFYIPILFLTVKSQKKLNVISIYGLVVGGVLTVMQGIFPFDKLVGGELPDFDLSYGLNEIAAMVEEGEKVHGSNLVVTTDYRTASLLAFEMRRLDIQTIGFRKSQFDLWSGLRDCVGKDAIILAHQDSERRRDCASIV